MHRKFLYIILASLLFLTPQTFAEFQKGINLVNFIGGDPIKYCSSDLTITLNELQAHGVNHINLTLWVFQEELNSEEIDYRSGAIDEQCLGNIIAAAHSRSMKINLRPVLIIKHERPGEWRGEIPGHAGWFSSYRNMTEFFAKLAEKTGVDQLTLGSELVKAMTNHPEEWVKLLRVAKTEFSGAITYSANHGYEFDTLLQKVAEGEPHFSAFFKELDFLGIDLYSSLTLSRDKIPTYAQAKSVSDVTARKLGQLVSAANAKHGLNKKIVLAEVGFKNSDHALFRPYEWDDPDGKPNEAVQALGTRVILETYMNAPFIEGIYFWEWDIDPKRANTTDKSFNLQSRAAAVILKEYYNNKMKEEDFHKAYTYMQWGIEWNEAERELTALRAIGAEYVAVVPLWYQNTKHDLNIEPHPYLSPTRDQLKTALLHAKKNRLKIMLKPHIDVFQDPWRGEVNSREEWIEKWGTFQSQHPILRPFNSSGDDENHINWFERLFTSWRGNIEPPQEGSEEEWLTAWFESYEKFIFWHAEIAKEVGVEFFCLASELERMDRFTPYWRDLILKLRAFFYGTGTSLTYDAMPDSVMKNQIWPYLDYIAVSAYFPLTLFKYKNVDQLQKGWKQHLDLMEKWLKEKHPSKLVLFAEAGFTSLAGTSQRPWDWKMYADISEQEQADCMQASLIELPKRSWLKGAYYWRWTVQEDYPLFNYDYYTPYNKKAEGVIKEFWLGK